MKRSGFEIIACAISLFATGASAHRALAAFSQSVSPQAVSNAPVVLSNEALGQFETAFGTISTAAQVTIAAEGVPFRQRLLPAEASALNSSVVGQDVDLDEEVSLIALAYDYDAERTSRHCFLLRKRHSDPNDLPDVTYGEIAHSLQAVLGTIDSLMPAQTEIWGRSPVFDFYDSLTPEQLAHAQDGIALSELDPTQRKLALSTATQFAVSAQTLQTLQLRSVLNQLLALQDDRTVFTWTSTSRPLQFGYEGPFGANGATEQVPLSDSYKSQTRSYSPADHSAGPILPTQLDRRLAPGMLSNRLPSTLALGEFARSIAGETKSDLALSVDPAIDGKPICLFGATFTEKGRLIRDIAALYGLRVETTDNHDIALSLPRRGAIRDRDDVPAELARLIPPSLLRYTSWRPWSTESETSGVTEEPQTARAKRIAIAEANHNEIYIQAGMVTSDSYYSPAAKRLRVLAEPSVPTKDSPPIRVKSLGPEPACLIALMALASRGMNQLGKLREYVPPACLFDLDGMIVRAKGGRRDFGNATNKWVSASFGYQDETGKFKAEVASIVTTGVAK